MEQSIKELIELSTSSGTLKPEVRDLIYQKAEEKGINQTECDIYINAGLSKSKTVNNNIPTGGMFQNKLLYVIVVIVLTIAYYAYSRYETDRIYNRVMDDSKQMQRDIEKDVEKQMEKYNY
ncbi:MAG: hypothetical protein EXR20_08080 [Bacteroidetes bacterium]|jgi:hypothetical protein|nr:hypothetical protein [Bacteroidota bacterium]